MPDDPGLMAEKTLSGLSLKLACEPRASVFDRAQLDTVVDITDLSNLEPHPRRTARAHH